MQPRRSSTSSCLSVSCNRGFRDAFLVLLLRYLNMSKTESKDDERRAAPPRITCKNLLSVLEQLDDIERSLTSLACRERMDGVKRLQEILQQELPLERSYRHFNVLSNLTDLISPPNEVDIRLEATVALGYLLNIWNPCDKELVNRGLITALVRNLRFPKITDVTAEALQKIVRGNTNVIQVVRACGLSKVLLEMVVYQRLDRSDRQLIELMAVLYEYPHPVHYGVDVPEEEFQSVCLFFVWRLFELDDPTAVPSSMSPYIRKMCSILADSKEYTVLLYGCKALTHILSNRSTYYADIAISVCLVPTLWKLVTHSNPSIVDAAVTCVLRLAECGANQLEALHEVFTPGKCKELLRCDNSGRLQAMVDVCTYGVHARLNELSLHSEQSSDPSLQEVEHDLDWSKRSVAVLSHALRDGEGVELTSLLRKYPPEHYAQLFTTALKNTDDLDQLVTDLRVLLLCLSHLKKHSQYLSQRKSILEMGDLRRAILDLQKHPSREVFTYASALVEFYDAEAA